MCVEVCSYPHFCEGKVEVDVSITDSSSETSLQCKGQTRVPIKYRVVKLKIIDDDHSFHPCQATVVKVKNTIVKDFY